MTRFSARFALTLTLLAAPGCEERSVSSEPPVAAQAPSVTTTALTGETMGTTWTVKVVVASPEASQQVVGLRGHVQARLDAINKMMSTWDPQSELSRFNAHRGAAPVPVSAETARVVAAAKVMGERTGGAFDVTLGPLIRLWGFDRGGKKKVPTPSEVAAARARVGLGALSVSTGEGGEQGGASFLKKTKPDLEVNLSGIAKGYGVDAIVALLRARGVTRAMVEIGGEVATLGKSARGQPWKLGINVPRSTADPTAVLRTVSIEGRALATSGNYRNFFERGGKRYAHVLDPTSGEPTDHDLVSVTLLADDCMTADGLATAGLVMGEDKLRQVLAAHYPGAEALFVHAPRTLDGGSRAAPEGATARGGKTGAARSQGELRVTKTAGFPDA